MGPTGGLQTLEPAIRAAFEAHWRPPGYTCPNAERYPWQWLWDSAFHSIVWERLGRPDRAVAELATLFRGQDPATGFVPHVGYHSDPHFAAEFWGRSGWSSLTQPPMYGHAVAELVRRGVAVPPEIVEGAVAGVAFLTRMRRRSSGGLVELAHPWESGADDSLRWDDVMGGPGIAPEDRYARKGELLAAVERTASGAPVANPSFGVGAASFTALVAFNAAELASVTGDSTLEREAEDLSLALSARWDGDLATWVDDGPTAEGSARSRSVEAMLGVLVDTDPSHRDRAFAELCEPAAYGATFGPTGVHRSEPSYDPERYWRGPAWPQLTYLFWVAARRHGAHAVAAGLRDALVGGASHSGLAEYWHPDTAAGFGAVPQSWAVLALVAAEI